MHYLGFFSSKVNLRNRSTTFTLGSRDTVITTDLESPIIVVPHAQKSEKKVSIYQNISRRLHGCEKYEIDQKQQQYAPLCDHNFDMD